MRPVWLWHSASWASYWGVVCHCFPPPLDFPTFVARCLYVRHDARDPSSESCPVILPKFRLLLKFRDLLHAANLRHGIDGFTSPPKEGVLGMFFAYILFEIKTSFTTYTSWVCFVRVFTVRHSTNLIKLNLRYES